MVFLREARNSFWWGKEKLVYEHIFFENPGKYTQRILSSPAPSAGEKGLGSGEVRDPHPGLKGVSLDTHTLRGGGGVSPHPCAKPTPT